MAKKNIEQFIADIKEIFVDRELTYLEKLLNEEDPDKEEEKFLKQLKGRINFVEKMYNQMTGKTGKERSKANDEMWAKIIEMESSVGKIERKIPKTGTEDAV